MMSYTVVAVIACIFPAYLLVGIAIGIYHVVTQLARYFAAGWHFDAMFSTIFLFALLWPGMLIPSKERKEHDVMVRETLFEEMDAKWFLLRMSEGESAYTIAKSRKVDIHEMKRIIRLSAFRMNNRDEEHIFVSSKNETDNTRATILE